MMENLEDSPYTETGNSPVQGDLVSSPDPTGDPPLEDSEPLLIKKDKEGKLKKWKRSLLGHIKISSTNSSPASPMMATTLSLTSASLTGLHPHLPLPEQSRTLPTSKTSSKQMNRFVSQQIGEVKTHSVADQSSSIPLALVSKDDSTNDTIPDPFINQNKDTTLSKQPRYHQKRPDSPRPMFESNYLGHSSSTDSNLFTMSTLSKVTPGTDGMNVLGEYVKQPVVKKLILNKDHKVEVHVLTPKELPLEDSLLAVNHATDLNLKLELLGGLNGNILNKLPHDCHLVAPIVMVRLGASKPLIMKVTIPHALATTIKGSNSEIKLFAISMFGVPGVLEPRNYTLDEKNCIVTMVINKQQIFVLTVIGKLLTQSRSFLSINSSYGSPAIKCVYYVLSEPGNHETSVKVYCGIDLPIISKLLSEIKELPIHWGTFVLSHEHIDISYQCVKNGTGWTISNSPHTVNTSIILPSPRAELFTYPPVWEFKVFPRPDVKHVSERVTCELRIAAGKTKLAKQRFHHDRPASYCDLWTQQVLEKDVSTKMESISSLPKEIKTEVLQSVMFLLVTANINETLASLIYLKPLDGHENVYQFIKGEQKTKFIIYHYIGKYGTCPTAIRYIPAGFEAHPSADNVPDQYFPNLGAIISVGVACGIKGKVKICDILVSSKVITYKSSDKDISKREEMSVSPQLTKLFTKFIHWPDDKIRKRLNNNGISVPDVKDGAILSGPYHVDDPIMKKINNFSQMIGIEMEKTHLFAEIHQPMSSTIIVKAVCDFEDGKCGSMYQPTAALLAADLVHRCLSDPQAFDNFKGKMLLRQMLQQAKNEGLTINIRHAKILFCGASCAGKTSFSRLLRSQEHETVYKSTPQGNAQQVLISGKVKVEDTNWITLDGNLETQELTKRLKRLMLKLNNQEDTDKPSNYNVQSNNPTVTAATLTVETNLPLVESLSASQSFVFVGNELPFFANNTNDDPSNLLYDNIQTNEQIVTEERMVACNDIDSESIPKTWDLFTLLDTGGQPEFINMLPAINAYTAITFVVLDMSCGKKGLDNFVTAQYTSEGYQYRKCKLKYTNIHLLKCLLSSIKVAAMKKDYFHADIIKKVTEGEQSQPIVCIAGTHADVLKENFREKYDEELHNINKEVKKLVETIEKEDVLMFWCDADGNYVIPVDNTVSRESQNKDVNKDTTKTIQHKTIQNIERIRKHSNEILRKKAQYEIPISWFILELELRNNDKVCIPLTEVKSICDKIMPLHRQMEIYQIKEVLKFYHMFGMLLYFSEVDGIKEFVITNPQWLFINLSKIIMCRFEDSVNLFGAHYIKELHNGICDMGLLRELKLDLQGIELESFVKLLVHLRMIAPMINNKYFMPTILPLYNQKVIFTEKEYGKTAAFTLDGKSICQEVNPLLIEFSFGTIPRGLFGFLIVQLLEDDNKFELYGENDDDTLRRCVDLITFYIKPCYYVSLHDRISYLELQVRVKGDEPSNHYEVLTAVKIALKQVCDTFNWHFSDCRFGFLCQEHTKGSQSDHLTLLSETQSIPIGIPKYACCKSRQSTCLTTAHIIWFKELQEVSKSLGGKGKVQHQAATSSDAPELSTNFPAPSKPRILSLEPRMDDLISIVIPRINADWEDVAYALHYKIPAVKSIKTKHNNDPKKCCKELLTDWLITNNGVGPKVWSTLLDKLEKVEELTAAREEIRKELIEMHT